MDILTWSRMVPKPVPVAMQPSGKKNTVLLLDTDEEENDEEVK